MDHVRNSSPLVDFGAPPCPTKAIGADPSLPHAYLPAFSTALHRQSGATTSTAQVPNEAAPQTDKACTAPPLGANLPEASYLSQPRTCRLENRFEKIGSTVKIDAARDI